MKKWIQQCTCDHSICVEDLPQVMMPTRLIELDERSTTHARLIEVHENATSSPISVIRYAALSYCWGTSQQDGTTRSNLLSRLQQGLEVLALPKILQDTVLITKALGLRYLWIDSCCIIQDDTDDWAKESAKMAGIIKAPGLFSPPLQRLTVLLGFCNIEKAQKSLSCTHETVSMQMFVAQQCILNNSRRRNSLCSSERGLCKK